jgi:hypothetical protein
MKSKLRRGESDTKDHSSGEEIGSARGKTFKKSSTPLWRVATKVVGEVMTLTLIWTDVYNTGGKIVER